MSAAAFREIEEKLAELWNPSRPQPSPDEMLTAKLVAAVRASEQLLVLAAQHRRIADLYVEQAARAIAADAGLSPRI